MDRQAPARVHAASGYAARRTESGGGLDRYRCKALASVMGLGFRILALAALALALAPLAVDTVQDAHAALPRLQDRVEKSYELLKNAPNVGRPIVGRRSLRAGMSIEDLYSQHINRAIEEGGAEVGATVVRC